MITASAVVAIMGYFGGDDRFIGLAWISVALIVAVVLVLAACVVAVGICASVFLAFASAFMTSVHRSRRRAIAALGAQRDPAPPAADDLTAAGPPFEQIAEEIHRLNHTRRTSMPGTLRHVAATRAYDRRLVQACRALRIEESLLTLHDLDLDLERLRVEEVLATEGFVLDTGMSHPA